VRLRPPYYRPPANKARCEALTAALLAAAPPTPAQLRGAALEALGAAFDMPTGKPRVRLTPTGTPRSWRAALTGETPSGRPWLAVLAGVAGTPGFTWESWDQCQGAGLTPEEIEAARAAIAGSVAGRLHLELGGSNARTV
jgi:hypothetical protein